MECQCKPCDQVTGCSSNLSNIGRDYRGESYKEVCITYEDVNQAVKKAMRVRNYSRPKGIDSLEPPPEEIAETAEVIQEATRILAYR